MNTKDAENTTQKKPKNQLDTLTQERATESNAIDIPSVSLPKGGGALKGIDEKFEVNAANGTASFSIPLPLTPGRNGFTPSLALGYNSGSGNSPFGLGWSLQYPSIIRKSDKQLPRYREGNEEDIFMFSGAEDLVPYLQKQTAGDWEPVEFASGDYQVKRYRPRVEGGFARIEKITHPDHDTYWKVTTKENIVTFFGRSTHSRIADPEDVTRIYQWLPEFSFDNKGNWIRYYYKRDYNIDDDGSIHEDSSIPNHVHERNRKSGLAPFTNSYLKRVAYGNRQAYYPDPTQPYDLSDPGDSEYLFELVLDYGEHTHEIEPHIENDVWDYRDDPFSSFRAGFEIRTQRLCRRIMMFHHFEDETDMQGYEENGDQISHPFGRNYLVRTLELDHKGSSINDSGQTEVNYLISITQAGYIRLYDEESTPIGYSRKALPPLEFDYQQLQWNTEVRNVSQQNLVHTPVGLTNNYQFTDFYAEGISGILTEQGEGWFYKSNLGDIDEDGRVTLAEAKPVIPKPSLTGLANGALSLQDLEANGKKQVVVNRPGLQGFFELTEGNDWEPFQAFTETASIDLRDPNTRMLDLTGDGQPDLVMTEENVFTWHAANGKLGHKAAERSPKPYDEERGPALIFADSDQSEAVYLADFTGDGLTDIVRVRNGEICYWANKGYGNFSAKITMANAPVFDYPDQFNTQYIQLADISGTGAADIIYLGQNTFNAYINLSGNGWSDAHKINPFFPINRNAQVTVTDLLGTGTSCLVWSSDLPADRQTPMRYIDLMDSKKPHVMVGYRNNMGKETALEYKSSTYYYLKDKAEGLPWITKLPFPVQVIARNIVEDKITQVRFASQYRYHHGYYDHAEREFRGFGMVEQQDTEFYDTWNKANSDTRLEKSEELYQPPVLTKTWFHTGAFLDRERILTQFEKEYWYEVYNNTFPEAMLTVNEPVLPVARVVSVEGLDFDIENLRTEEWREALRACKGMTLRQEVFALDGKEADTDSLQLQAKPYTIATHTCNIQLLQPRAANRYAVFMPTESEALSIHYERNEKDPRIAHTLNIEFDDLGNILKTASVVYPRQNAARASAINAIQEEVRNLDYARPEEQDACLAHLDELDAEQQKTLITFTCNKFTEDLIDSDLYLLRLPAENQTFEITGLQPSDTLFQIGEFDGVMDPDNEIAYHEESSSGLQRRLIEHIQTTYYNDDLTTELGLYEHGQHGIPYQGYQLAYTPELLDTIFGDKLPSDPSELENLLSDNDTDGDNQYSQCRFVHRDDNNWWIRSGVTRFYLDERTESIRDIEHRFFTPQSYLDPFGSETWVTYYRDYFMMTDSTTDALDNQTEVQRFNFRTLSPTFMRDINHNLSEVFVDELGLVKAMAVMGKGDEADNLHGISEITTEANEESIRDYFVFETTEDLRRQAREFLQNATARFVYDFKRYQSSMENRDLHDAEAAPCTIPKLIPTTVGSIMREKHVAVLAAGELSNLQLSFEYTDGMGNVVMTKAQAEPGEALQLQIQPDCDYRLETIDTSDSNQLRWIGNGRTILNNKGNPVKQYEPYFSVNPFYEDAKELVEGEVTPVIHYDALGRNVYTELPNGTFTAVEFDTWQQRTFDQNDNILQSTWYTDRVSGGLGSAAREAAEKSVIHNNSPNRVFLDTLGRPILSIEHNKWQNNDAGTTSDFEELYSTYIDLDIEGNTRKVIDARDNPVMCWQYDMLGHRVFQESMDAGRRWMLNNVAGNPIISWDEKGHMLRHTYGELQRPISTHITGGDSGLDHTIARTIYGEGLTDAINRNLRGQVYQQFDSSGLVQNERLDFKGNLLIAWRRLLLDAQAEVTDWADDTITRESLLEEEIFIKTTTYDALNRMAEMHNWHSVNTGTGIYLPHYNERGVLQSETLSLNGTDTPAIRDIQYNEKGQRQRIHYGNDTVTQYSYDPKTFRLIKLRTTRSPHGSGYTDFPASHFGLKDLQVLQDLNYTYDPVGNITEVYDDAYETVFHDSQEVVARSRYTYDSLYRLIKATGRENNTYNEAPNRQEPPVIHLNSPNEIRNYTQIYSYDAVGNFNFMQHVARGNGWTRHYETASDSNRLDRTYTNSDPGGISYGYDPHGSMLNFGNEAAPYLPDWDYRDMISHIDLGGGGDAWYQYDASKQRTRKHIRKNGGIIEERIYLEGMEVYRRQGNGVVRDEVIETHHLFADDQKILIVEDVRVSGTERLSEGTLFRYQYSNHLGSVGLELNEERQIISYEEYHPYGTPAYRAKNSAIEAKAKRYRYTGMERDEETGLNYHTARYYLPWLGRWCSSDPIGVEGGGNLYEYSRGNSINIFDPNGEQPIDGFQLSERAGRMMPIARSSSIYFGALRNHPERGWLIRDRNRPRRVGARRGDRVPNEELITSLTSIENANRVATQLNRIRETNSIYDPSLILTIAHREFGANIFANGRVNSFYGGGLDNLFFDIATRRQIPLFRRYLNELSEGFAEQEGEENHDRAERFGEMSRSRRMGRLRRQGLLPNDFPSLNAATTRRGGRVIGTLNEAGEFIFPALLPTDRILEVVAAKLTLAHTAFMSNYRRISEELNLEIEDDISTEARRFWTASFFGASESSRRLLRQHLNSGLSINELPGVPENETVSSGTDIRRVHGTTIVAESEALDSLIGFHRE
ncbi:insecticidal toxin complex protein [Fulvivirga sp. 29W222]|uniref:Insecticidal toxin complex protein n=1 Tax=Fulvivirga marina TaxID=2494733 RepID=A0A937FZ51_9BACT|nr:SpvB/TcaC N-terminal domain-containing protein [Fulvivirga marina]MBL6447658.1 insecticidal toxin complex protein [Fulvivirga marina]